MVYTMSFTILNKKIIDELSTEDFVKGHKDNIFFDKQKSIFYIKGKQVKINAKNKNRTVKVLFFKISTIAINAEG